MPKLKAATHLLLRRPGGELFFIRRGKTPYYQGWLSLVAGHVEPSESPDLALCREAEEEVGISISPADLEFFCVGTRHLDGLDYHDFFFAARTWQGEPVSCEPEKILDPGWRRLTEVRGQTVPYILRALEAVDRGESYFVFDERTKAQE